MIDLKSLLLKRENGTVYKTAQLNSSNDWKFCFDNLPNAKYTVEEISVEGYHTPYSGTDGNVYTIINTLSVAVHLIKAGRLIIPAHNYSRHFGSLKNAPTEADAQKTQTPIVAKPIYTV